MQTTGTGEILRLSEVQKWITTDFIVLPCDLISEIDGSRFVQEWMTLNPPATASSKPPRKTGLSVFYATHGVEGISHKKDETDFIATTELPKAPVEKSSSSLRPHIERLVMCMPTDTLNDKLTEDQGFLRVRQSLLNHHSRVKLKMKYRDAHIYIFPRWIKDFVAENERFDSISEDVLGWWAKAQWQDGLPAKLGLDHTLGDGKTLEESLDGLPEEEEDIDPALLSSSKSLPVVESSTAVFASRVRLQSTSTPQKVNVPPLLAYVQPGATSPESPQPLIRRIDTTHQLLTVSLHLAKLPAGHKLAHENKVHPTAQLGQNSRVSVEDSLVGENVQIGMQCTVKESVIGANCEIGNKVRLTRCLLMEGVHVGDGVQLTGCIIGRRAKLQGMKPAEQPGVAASGTADGAAGAKAKGKKKVAPGDEEDDRTKLTDCEVAPNFVVEAGTEAKGEKLMAFDTEGDFDKFHDGDEDDEE